ncbi:hypothetical protein [uncultured Roseobacter sp.]|uniref:hypothetical protein n=1 Tax=uncultured Roseobacter sp. TaxID=114847 RepID=UPI00261D5078|nr:hypothetical protein [uncultured Roseobacter sp.]
MLGQAAVAGVLSGISLALAPGQETAAPTAQEITLNRIQPITNGLIVYGERTVGGTIVARSTTASSGKANARYHSVIPLACHEIEGAEAIYIGETLVWTRSQYITDTAAGTLSEYSRGQIGSPFRHRVGLRVYNGADDQTADPFYRGAASEWTENARGRGVAYLYFTAIYDQNLFPRGVEQIRVRIKGKKVFDPRSGLTEFSSNPALHARDYALTSELRGGIGWSEEDIDDAGVVALANIADEQIPLDGGGAEDRYQFNGVLDTGISPEQNLDRLASSWGGWWTCDKGLLTFGGGAFEVPAVSLTEDDMAAPIRVRARRPFEDQFNVVKAVYSDPESAHVATDLPVLSSNTYRAQDNDQELVRDLGELPGEVGFARGQRLMKLALLKGRRQKNVDVPCTLSAFGVSLGDNIRLTVPRRGWTEKTFEVVGRTATIQSGIARVGLSLLESGPEVFDWQTSEETAKPAGGIPTLASPTDLPVVLPPTVTEEPYETRGGGGIKTRVLLGGGSDNPFIDAWQFSHQISGGDEVLGPLTQNPETVFNDMQPGTYVFGSRALNRRGMVGDWAYTNPTQVLGLNDTPTEVSGLVVQAAGGAVAMMRWDRHPSLDVRQGGRIEFRHSPSLTAATWQSSTSIGKAVSGDLTVASLPLKSGTYLARAFDALNIPGPVTMATTKAASLSALIDVTSVNEHPSFAGAKTNCAVDNGDLAMDLGALSAEYVFDNIIDLGSVQAVRLVTEMTVLIGRRDDLFWDRGGVPFWQRGGDLFWQSSAAFGDVDVLVSETDDDPVGAPVWSDFQSLDAADFSARAFRFKAVLSVENVDFNIRVSTLRVTAKQGA